MSAKVIAYVYTTDAAKLREFYEVGLGVTAQTPEGAWQPFDVGGATFALHAVANPNDRPIDRVNLSFEVDDIESAFERFRAQGAKVLRGVADEAFGKEAILQDPDGRTFSLVKHE